MTSNDNVGAISASTHINTNDSSINNGFNMLQWWTVGPRYSFDPGTAVSNCSGRTSDFALWPCRRGIPVTWHSKLVDLVAASKEAKRAGTFKST